MECEQHSVASKRTLSQVILIKGLLMNTFPLLRTEAMCRQSLFFVLLFAEFIHVGKKR